MRSNIRGILIFLIAFLVGTAVVPPPTPMLGVPPVVDEPLPPAPPTIPFRSGIERFTPLGHPASFTIEIRRIDADFEIEERFIRHPGGGPITTYLDLTLGESIERQLIIIHSPVEQTFKVEMQYETSMALGDEGPHLDLVHWKHHTSPWQTIQPTAANAFPVPEIPEAELTRFPNVTTNDIVAAVRNSGAEKRWLDLARTCIGPNNGPCYVSTSRISFRISVKQNDAWKLAHTLNFSIPMGC
jgi:hypothetical protein